MDPLIAIVIATPLFIAGFFIGGYFWDNGNTSTDLFKPFLTGLALALISVFLIYKKQHSQNKIEKRESKSVIAAFIFLVVVILIATVGLLLVAGEFQHFSF